MTAGAQTVLVVEDEASIASFVSLYLKNAGYDVRAVTTGTAALAQVAAETPALIILDLMLPDIDGIEICRRVRKTSDVPILMLTARDEDVDKIIGLEVGADDYLTKPFNPRELVARVKSVLRRSAPERRRDVEEELHHGDLSINAGRREVKVGEEEIQLAPKEFDLLWELLDHTGLVLTRDQLLERVWGYTFAGDTRTVDVHVRQLRRKLGEASPIVTVWGVGYKVGPDAGLRSAARRTAMLNSLRFRLPALFLAGIALSGLVTSLIALRLFQDYTRTASLNELRREADGTGAAVRGVRRPRRRRGEGGADVRGAQLELATGDRLFYVGTSLSPGEDSGLTQVTPRTVGVDLLDRRGSSPSSSGRPGRTRTFLAAAHPIRLGRRDACSGYLIVAKPKDELRDAWVTLLSRLAIAFLFSLVVVGALALYLTRRITGPVLALSDAADEVAQGQLRRRGAARSGRRRDRPPRRPLPRDDVAARARPRSSSATS